MNNIYIYKNNKLKYPDKQSIFSPSEQYPEYIWKHLSNEENTVYKAVRDIFYESGFDKSNYGTIMWNPLASIIKENDIVLIKPNMVKDSNEIEANGVDCLYTNPSLVRVVVDYVIIALKGTGRIVIADVPVQSCDFDKFFRESGYEEIINFYKGNNVDIEFYDLRGEIAEIINGLVVRKKNLFSYESICVDLEENSAFYGLSKKQLKRLRVTNYDARIMNRYHTCKKHEYSVSKIALEANVIINMPKIKTHRKGGITAALKNIVGINTNKDYLPHHRLGALINGGDEYDTENILCKIAAELTDIENRLIGDKRYLCARIFNFLKRGSQKILRITNPERIVEGNWNGNDTIWRMVSDLNKILLYMDCSGSLRNEFQRKILIIGDMIISGEGEGPLQPSPKYTGCIVVGSNPVLYDMTIAKLLGYDYKNVPVINNNFMMDSSFDKIKVHSNNKTWDGIEIGNFENVFDFIRPKGWE